MPWLTVAQQRCGRWVCIRPRQGQRLRRQQGAMEGHGEADMRGRGRHTRYGRGTQQHQAAVHPLRHKGQTVAIASAVVVLWTSINNSHRLQARIADFSNATAVDGAGVPVEEHAVFGACRSTYEGTCG